jgi:hypothetical protein
LGRFKLAGRFRDTFNIRGSNIYLAGIVVVEVVETGKPPSSIKIIHEEIPELKKFVVRTYGKGVYAFENFKVVCDFQNVLVKLICSRASFRAHLYGPRTAGYFNGRKQRAVGGAVVTNPVYTYNQVIGKLI